MLNSIDFSGRPFHLIGIGGIGMSALAYVLAKRKLPVSGSDIRPNPITDRLQALGVQVVWQQDATYLEQLAKSPELSSRGECDRDRPSTHLPQVICSTAIAAANAEYQAAVALGCPIFHRSELLAALMQDYQSIAVAGTHGKTTTSSLIGYLLWRANLDPTVIVGGEVTAWGGNAYVGEGPYLVAEADESDGSLTRFAPAIGVITNIELDHPDYYQSLEQVVATFRTFAQRCETVIGCIDCATVRNQCPPAISYSLDPELGATYTADAVQYLASGTQARIWERGQVLGVLSLRLLGSHNLSNALAAIAVGRALGIEFVAIARILGEFTGTRRRFEHRGTAAGITFIDDYAHHPSELRATLAAARLQIGNPIGGVARNGTVLADEAATDVFQRVIAVFQPHRYSRTQAFLKEFAQAFGNADQVVITDIYSAGEVNSGMITGQQVAQLVQDYHPQVVYQPSLQAVKTYLSQALTAGDLVLFLGAGNLNQVIPEIVAFYRSQGATHPPARPRDPALLV
ncbi:UDP-N-acetylmuramate--L-alanine ligase [Trichothermofontia sp.]